MPTPARDSAGCIALIGAIALAWPLAAFAASPGVARAGGGKIRITVEPPRLVLWHDARAEIHIHPPPNVTDLIVTANVGHVEEMKPLPTGGFAARYRPPADRFPQVAIVSAVGRSASGSVDGWVAIPLHGQGDARVRTRPNAEITLRIGDEHFGPRRADASGIAIIPVIVPPGVREAYHGFRPIDLKLPDARLLHIALDRLTVPADVASELTVRAYVVTPHGSARAGDPPGLEPSRGTLGPVSAVETGAFEAAWRLPPGPAGAVQIVGRLPGAPGSVAVARIDALPGPPASIAVAFDRERMVAGEADAAVVTARALDAAGNTTAGELKLSSDGGELSHPVEIAPGAYRAILRVPPRFRGRDRVKVLATTTEPWILGSRSLPLAPGAPAKVALEPGHPFGFAGGPALPLRLSVSDRFGNPVSGLAPTGSAARGALSRIAPDGPGEYVVRYVPPSASARLEDQISVSVGPLTARAAVDLVPAQPLVALAPKLGLATDLRRFASPYIGAEAELLPRRLPYGLSVGADAGWFHYDGDLADQRAGTASGGCFVLLAMVSLRDETHTRALLWGGAGAGLAVRSADTPGSPPSTDAAPTLSVAVGGGYRTLTGIPFGELRVLRVNTGASPAAAFTALTVNVGWRWEPAWAG